LPPAANIRTKRGCWRLMPARRARLQWRPRVPLGEALSWTVEWYKRQLKGEAVGALVGEQIERYERAVTV
jgi:hypothetical protein